MDETEALRLRIEELEKQLAEREKNRKDIAHDLRATTTPLKGFIQVLLDDKNEEWYLKEDRREFYTIINDNIERQSNLIEELIGNIPSPRRRDGLVMKWTQNVDIREILEDVVAIQRERTDKHQFVLDFEPERILIETDTDKFANVFHNLLSNAVQSSPKGEIRLTVRLQSPSQDYPFGMVRIQVQDQGVGFHKTQFNFLRQEKIYLQPSIGIFLVRAIVICHHGTVEIDSEGSNKGTTVTVCIPIKQPEETGEEFTT